jgi:hypothetical protein
MTPHNIVGAFAETMGGRLYSRGARQNGIGAMPTRRRLKKLTSPAACASQRAK